MSSFQRFTVFKDIKNIVNVCKVSTRPGYELAKCSHQQNYDKMAQDNWKVSQAHKNRDKYIVNRVKTSSKQ